MVRRPISIFVKHFAAMQLILTMQDADGNTPNIAFVRENPTPLPVSKFPDDKKYEMFKYLQDMFPLVDAQVYKAFFTMVTEGASVPGTVIDFNTLQDGTQFNTGVLRAAGAIGGFELWSGDPPHGCYWIMREVVADLLS